MGGTQGQWERGKGPLGSLQHSLRPVLVDAGDPETGRRVLSPRVSILIKEPDPDSGSCPQWPGWDCGSGTLRKTSS